MDLARESGAKLVLLRAAEAHTLPMTDPIEAQVDVMREAEEYLDAARARVMAAGVADVEVSAWYGPAVESIVEAARHRQRRPDRDVEPRPQRAWRGSSRQRRRARAAGDRGADSS